MDSLTQLTLGAAVGAAVVGRPAARRAALWGGVCGTLPDLDVLISFGDPVADFTYHRGYSHSLLVLTIAAPLIWALLRRLDPVVRAADRRWLLAIWLALVTHPVLDAATVYGTQLLLPFTDYPVSGSAIFIIDPLVTLPLVVGVVATALRPRSAAARRWLLGGLAASALYLAFAVVAKLHVESRVAHSLPPGVAAGYSVLTTPAPFNTLLWRIVVVEADGYYEGYYSLFDPPGPIRYERHTSESGLLEPIADAWAVRRLQWFTHGFYRVRQAGDTVVVTDLRMGGEPFYAFSFAVGELDGETVRPIPPVALEPERPRRQQIGELFARILGPAPAAAEPLGR